MACGNYAAPIGRTHITASDASCTPLRKSLQSGDHPPMNSVRGRTRRGDVVLFETLQVFLCSGVAEVSSAAIPGRGLSGVVQSTANTGPAAESRIESHAQTQRSAPVSCIGRSFVEQARRYDVSGAQESIAASHERGHLCSGQALVGRGLRWRWRGGERCGWRGRLFLYRSR